MSQGLTDHRTPGLTDSRTPRPADSQTPELTDSQTHCFFFDRDGIVNKRIVGDYVKRPEEFEFLPEFFSLFRFVKEKGYLAIVITNQQGVGKGLMSEEELHAIHGQMQEGLREKTGFTFDDIYSCPDLAARNSIRRKPQPGMLLEAIEKWNIHPGKSWMIGDSIGDVQAGRAAGVGTILIGEYSDVPEADFIFQNLREAEAFLRREIIE